MKWRGLGGSEGLSRATYSLRGENKDVFSTFSCSLTESTCVTRRVLLPPAATVLRCHHAAPQPHPSHPTMDCRLKEIPIVELSLLNCRRFSSQTVGIVCTVLCVVGVCSVRAVSGPARRSRLAAICSFTRAAASVCERLLCPLCLCECTAFTQLLHRTAYLHVCITVSSAAKVPFCFCISQKWSASKTIFEAAREKIKKKKISHWLLGKKKSLVFESRMVIWCKGFIPTRVLTDVRPRDVLKSDGPRI